MSGGVLVFVGADDPPAQGPDPLVPARWVAERSSAALEADSVPVVRLEGEDATRARLTESLGEESAGVAFFAHGNERGVYSRDAAVLDPDNVRILRGRWAHAVACRVGLELARAAVDAGARCFAGYDVSLIMEWDPDSLPHEVEPAFAGLVSAVTLGLAEGSFVASDLKRRASGFADEVAAWCEENHESDAAQGLAITAQQLVDRLCVYVSED